MLTITQLINIGFPIITIPYLIKIIGIHGYGLIAFNHSFVGFAFMIIGFGFNTSAVKYVASNQDCQYLVSESVSAVTLIKFILLIPIALIVFLTTRFGLVSIYNQNLFLLSFLLCPAEALSQTWFFQGVNRVEFLAIATMINRGVVLIGIFLFIKGPEHILVVPIIYFLGHLMSSAFSIFILRYKFSIRLGMVSIRSLLYHFFESLSYFTTSFAVQAISGSSKLFLGLSGLINEVAFFDLAEKVISILKLPQSLYTQSVFPILSKKFHKNLVTIGAWIWLLLNIIFSIIFFFLGKKVVFFFGGLSMMPTNDLIRILLLTVPLVGLSNVFLYQIFIPLNKQNIGRNIILFFSSLNITALSIGFYLHAISAMFISWLLVFTEFLITATFALLLIKWLIKNRKFWRNWMFSFFKI